MTINVLGIDLGTNVGWAVCRDGKIVASGVAAFHGVADKGYGAMFAAFRRFLAGVRRDHGPFAAIAYELPFHRGAITSRITGGMAAHIMERAYAWRCRALPVQTMTLKKAATGSGKAGKPEMIEAAWKIKCRSGHPLEVPGEHEADAIHVARWGDAVVRKERA